MMRCEDERNLRKGRKTDGVDGPAPTRMKGDRYKEGAQYIATSLLDSN